VDLKMPFIIVNGPTSVNKSVEATLCEANLLGQPDKRSRISVLIRRISEQALLIEPQDPREIISTLHRDGQTTYAVAPGRRDLVASARLARLAKADELLGQLRHILTAVPADNSTLNHLAAVAGLIKSRQVDKL